MVCPPFTALGEVSKAILDSNIRLGAQNMSEHNFGAFTGEIAAGMLKEFSVRYVILGHSERRQYQKESDALIAKKALRGPRGLAQADCLRRRNAGRTRRRPDGKSAGNAGARQPGRVDARSRWSRPIVAYEPVWAIGTGKTATTAQAQEAHAFIRRLLAKMFDETVARRVRIQYGGSVKPSNARELMSQPDVDGALVGGASLEARSFADIIKNSI